MVTLNWSRFATVPPLGPEDAHLWLARSSAWGPADATPGRLVQFLLSEYVGRRLNLLDAEAPDGRIEAPGLAVGCAISRTQGALLVGVTRKGRIGVKLERLRSDIPYFEWGLEREALARVRQNPPQQRNEMGVKEWCRQEAARIAGSPATLMAIPPLPGYAVAAATDGPRRLTTYEFALDGD